MTLKTLFRQFLQDKCTVWYSLFSVFYALDINEFLSRLLSEVPKNPNGVSAGSLSSQQEGIAIVIHMLNSFQHLHYVSRSLYTHISHKSLTELE